MADSKGSVMVLQADRLVDGRGGASLTSVRAPRYHNRRALLVHGFGGRHAS